MPATIERHSELAEAIQALVNDSIKKKPYSDERDSESIKNLLLTKIAEDKRFCGDNKSYNALVILVNRLSTDQKFREALDTIAWSLLDWFPKTAT